MILIMFDLFLEYEMAIKCSLDEVILCRDDFALVGVVGVDDDDGR
jgi:hypothetical protein